MKNRMKIWYKIRVAIAAIIGILSVLALFGVFYKFKFLNAEFTPLLQSTIFDFKFGTFFILLGVVIVTLLFGRFYCSTLCPLGILQEFIMFAQKIKVGKEPLEQLFCTNRPGTKVPKPQKSLPFKYFIAAVTFGALVGGSALLIRYSDPYTIFGSAFTMGFFGLIAIALILALVFFKKRFFCTNICPVGAVLGLISKVSLNKIQIEDKNCVSCGLCAKNCPSECIDIENKTVNNETCVKCLKCTSLCPKGAIKYGKIKEQVTFSPKRREIILSTLVLATFSGAIKAGVEISKAFGKLVKEVILPPGAQNALRMANKCLNCNLCIENCPNKILVKADSAFSAVHIDYSKGKGYCKFDCIECSKTCPTGAIKRLTLQEKQETRVAMAAINPEKCNNCGLCTFECPKGAISKENDKTVIDGSKCIGCGKCKTVCRFGAIEIFGIKEQTII